MRATGGDSHLGWEDFDNILIATFADELRCEHNVDIAKNKKVLRELRAACERVKQTLSCDHYIHYLSRCTLNSAYFKGIRENFSFFIFFLFRRDILGINDLHRLHPDTRKCNKETNQKALNVCCKTICSIEFPTHTQ